MIQNLDKLILKIKKIKIKPVNFLDQKYIVRYRNYLTRFDDELKTNKRICEFKNTFKGKICKPNHLLCIFPTGVPRNCNGLMNDINFIANNSHLTYNFKSSLIGSCSITDLSPQFL
jgi:hypothetical protein